MEFINHFGLSSVGIHLLIFCQIVTGSVVSALGAGRGRQAGDITLVLQGAGSGWKELPWMGAHASHPPLQEGVELNPPEAACPASLPNLLLLAAV